jgi:hypothetical protein
VEVTMAEWQYLIHHVELSSGANLDQQLANALAEFGQKGWELAEVLPDRETPDGYRLIFKSAKPMD